MCKDKTSLGCPGNPDPCGCGCQDKAVQTKASTTTVDPQALVPSGYKKITADDFTTSLTPAPMEDSLEPSEPPTSGYAKKTEARSPSTGPSVKEQEPDDLGVLFGIGGALALLAIIFGKKEEKKKK